MNEILNAAIVLEATRLTRAGRLAEATALLQRRLRGEAAPNMSFGTASEIAPIGREPEIIDAKAETIKEADDPLVNAATSAQPHFRALLGMGDGDWVIEEPVEPGEPTSKIRSMRMSELQAILSQIDGKTRGLAHS